MKRLVISLLSIFSIVFASQATTYTVTSNADAGAGTLRQALATAAGDALGPHVIIFNAAMTITINSDLQINTGNHNGITINGFVDGVDGPDVIIRSSGTMNNQMVFNGTVGAKVYGLVFQNLDYGIHFSGATTSVIKGCYFGTNAAGTAIVNGINRSGVYIQNGGTTANNIVGGLLTNLANGDNSATNNSERCIFAGCAQITTEAKGVRTPALLVMNAGGTQVINNYFGVDVTGAVKLGNGNQTTKKPLAQSNIYMNNAINGVIDRNVISGATGSGIHLENWCNNVKIKGNKIGTNAAGTAAYNATTPSLSFGNEACGIFIQGGTGVVIGYDGGTIANERNIISGNGGAKNNNWQQDCDEGFNDFNQYGIYAESAGSTTLKGNYIGTDITGNSSGTNNVFGNRAGGVKFVTVSGVGNSNSTLNIIGGGTTVNDRNVISGNGYLWKASDNSSGCSSGPQPTGIAGGPGILLQYANTSSNTISGNYIGLGADGTTKLGNNQSGIELLGAASNNIGTAGVPNYICDNTWGIFLQVDYGTPYLPATNNTIAGNIIGLTTSNTAAGNGVRADNTDGGGIGLQMGVNANKIGLASANGGNVISGNRVGISIQTNSTTAGATAPTNNTIYNNIIGLDPTGATAIPNTSAAAGYGYGIKIEMGPVGTVFPFANIIGGTAANQANIISGNQKSGVYINNATAITAGTANTVVGNNIGTNKAGTSAVANGQQGIEIVNVSKTTITSNLISGNTQNGISLTGSSTNTIQNNIIGSNATKSAPIPNASNGISLSAGSASNIIGGVNANEPNFIFNNGANGVVVDGAASINNSIHKNSFSCNTNRGIVLSNGGNNSLAAPTIAGTPTQITWTGGTFIEVFETDGCATCPADPTRLQGKTFVASGTSPFVFTTALGFDKTKTYTALAHAGSTTAAHNSSEFSQCYTLCQDPTSVSITAGGPLTFCAGGSVTLTATVVGGVGTPTYVWKNAGTIIAGATTDTYVATTAGTYTVTYTSTQTCGPTTSTVTTVTINPSPSISDQTPAAICSGTAFTVTPSGAGVPAGTTYTWTAPVVTGGITGGSAQATGQTSISQTLTNPGTGTGTVTYTVTPTSGAGCPGATFKVTVTVNPKATVTTTDPAAICSGATTAISLTSGSSPVTYAWTIGTASASVSGQAAGNGSSIAQTLTNSGTTTGTVQYVVTPTFGTCAGTAKTITVTVNPVVTVTTNDPAAICSGATTAISLTSASSPVSYAWTMGTASAGISGYSAGTGTSIAQTLTNSGTAAGTVQYNVIPSFGGCAGTAKTITVTVNPVATVTTTDPAAICSGTTTAISLTSGSSPVTYTWTLGTVTGVTGAAAGNGATIAQTLTNTGTGVGAVQYVIVPAFGGCTGTSKTITALVNPVAKVTTADPAAICSGETTSITLTSSSSSVTYTWTLGTVTGATGASAGNGAVISQTLSNSGTAAGTVEYIVTPTINGCDGTAKTITVTVNPSAIITTADPASICSGATTAISLTSNVGTATFSWTIGTVSAGISGQSAGNGSNIAQTLTNSSNSAVGTVEYIVTPSAGGICAGTPKTITVSVNPVAVITTPNTASICSGETTAIALTSSVSSATYSWTLGTVTGASGAAAGNGSTIAQTLTTTAPATAGSVKYIVTASFGTCGGDAQTITVTVNPKPTATIALTSGSSSFCSGGSAELTATITGFTGGTFQWFNNGGSAGSTNPLTVSDAGIYAVKYTSASSCTSDLSNTIEITIKPNTSDATTYIDSVTTCLDSILLIAFKPTVGTGSWSIYSPNPATPVTLQPGLSVDSVTAIDLVTGVDYKFLYTVTGACGITTDTTFVSVGIDDFDLTASGPTDTLCITTNRNLYAQVIGKGGSGKYEYVWVGSDGSSFTTKDSIVSVIPKAASVTYTVYVKDLKQIGCITNDATVTLNAIESQKLYIPNLITPNGDAKNEIFYLADRTTYPGIEMPLIQEGSHLIVYNRWGTKVFEADNYDNNWNPKDLTDGVYYYYLTTACGNKEYKSWLQILGNKNN